MHRHRGAVYLRWVVMSIACLLLIAGITAFRETAFGFGLTFGGGLLAYEAFRFLKAQKVNKS